MINKDAYSLGGLLYMPVSRDNFIAKMAKGIYPYIKAFSLDMEDAMGDVPSEVKYKMLMDRLKDLEQYKGQISPEVKVFIRVQNPEMLSHVLKFEHIENVTGFILPKFDLTNIQHYIQIINHHKGYYYMPVLESSMLADPFQRLKNLYKIKEIICNNIEGDILNIRVGGNDFCNLYGVRRSAPQTIYDIRLIASILSDIVEVFSDRFIISGPVCEYICADDKGISTLIKELDMDKLNGFTGKTCIHPRQVEIVNHELMPSYTDYKDACDILDWKYDTGVHISSDGSRMLEVKCHKKWAERIVTLAEIYGVKGV